jgi:hypothetical protein
MPPNVYVNLPMPAANGAGATVNIAAQGKTKTIAVTGDMAKASVTIETSADGGVTWGPVISLTEPEVVNEQLVAGDAMRVFVRGRVVGDGFAAVCNVGADPGGVQVISLAQPATPDGNGFGAAVSAASLGSFKTFICSGSFPGATIQVEGSNDAGATWGPIVGFSSRGKLVSKVDVSQQYRIRVAGRKSTSPFSGVVRIAAAEDPVTPAGAPSNWQTFTYVATGAEGTAFNMAIPVAQPDAAYDILFALYTVQNNIGLSFPTTGRTTGLFPVVLTAPLTAGDTIRFHVFNAP